MIRPLKHRLMKFMDYLQVYLDLVSYLARAEGLVNSTFRFTFKTWAKSAGAREYTDCISAEE